VSQDRNGVDPSAEFYGSRLLAWHAGTISPIERNRLIKAAWPKKDGLRWVLPGTGGRHLSEALGFQRILQRARARRRGRYLPTTVRLLAQVVRPSSVGWGAFRGQGSVCRRPPGSRLLRAILRPGNLSIGSKLELKTCRV